MTNIKTKALSSQELAKHGWAWIKKPAIDREGRLVEGHPGDAAQTPNYTLDSAMHAFAEEGDVLSTTVCPITYDAFQDPLLLTDGNVYERVPIKKWLADNKTSPMNNGLMPNIQAGKVRAVRDPTLVKLAKFARSDSTPPEVMYEELAALGVLKHVGPTPDTSHEVQPRPEPVAVVEYLEVAPSKTGPELEAAFTRQLDAFMRTIDSLNAKAQLVKGQVNTLEAMVKTEYEHVAALGYGHTTSLETAGKIHALAEDHSIACARITDILHGLFFDLRASVEESVALNNAALLADAANPSGDARSRRLVAQNAWTATMQPIQDAHNGVEGILRMFAGMKALLPPER